MNPRWRCQFLILPIVKSLPSGVAAQWRIILSIFLMIWWFLNCILIIINLSGIYRFFRLSLFTYCWGVSVDASLYSVRGFLSWILSWQDEHKDIRLFESYAISIISSSLLPTLICRMWWTSQAGVVIPSLWHISHNGCSIRYDLRRFLHMVLLYIFWLIACLDSGSLYLEPFLLCLVRFVFSIVGIWVKCVEF